jgi:hypothetical protein
VLSNKLACLDGTKLAEFWLGVLADDLEKGVEGGRRRVVRLVERRCGRLDTLGVGCVG